MKRFSRLEQLIGKNAFKKLSKSRVAVFGLGAVGSFVVESLARSGIGEFLLIDFDEIRYTNFNRHLLALESNTGKIKVDLAKERILEINHKAKVIIHRSFAGGEDFSGFLIPRPDVVIDAIDSLNPKTQLISFCVSYGYELISSMGTGGKTDPFSVRIGDISEAANCPLAKRLQKRLKEKGISGVRCVYSIQKPVKSSLGVKEEDEFFQRGRIRRPVGSIFYMAGIFGLIISSDVIRIISGISDK